MRRSRWVRHARDLGPQDHVCWCYDDSAEFRLRAREFLVDGLAAGQQVCYIGPGDVDAMIDELAVVPELRTALRDGAARVVSLDEGYPTGTVVDPREQVLVYATATRAAEAAGFTGLRVAAEATNLVRTPEQLAAFIRYEHLIDRYMSANPFSAMCAYDRRELSEEAVARLACMHPQTNNRSAGFRLHAAVRTPAAALAGEVDMANRHLLDSALERVELHVEDGYLHLDATGLTFIDHAGLLRLADYAARRQATLVLRTDWPGACRLVQVLDVPGVRVEQAA